MATVLQLLLNKQVSAEALVTWLGNKSNNNELPGGIESTDNLRTEFIAFFLNFLRDQTLHLLQNAKSSNTSPVKTPSTQKVETPVQKRATSSAKRVQLFSDSPADCFRPDIDNVSPLFSPNSSVDSAHIHHRFGGSDRMSHNDYHRKRWDGDTPNRRRSSLSQTPEAQRTKQKLCLGEFLLTPESGNSRRRRSPYSSREASPSPTAQPPNRRAPGRKKGGSPLIRSNEDARERSSPVFSLISMNDFPPVGGADEKREKSDTKSVPNKSPEASKPRRITLTPVTKCPQELGLSPFAKAVAAAEDFDAVGGGGDYSGPKYQQPKKIEEKSSIRSSEKRKPRRINPTPVTKSTNQGSSPFSAAVMEVSPPVRGSGDAWGGKTTQHTLMEERELLRQEKLRRQKLIENDPCASPKSAKSDLDSVPCVTPTKTVLERKASHIEYVHADPSQVTHQHALDVMADLYSRALTDYLFPNLTVELYFLTQLLTSVGEEVQEDKDVSQESDEVKYFSSVHNAVYFAVTIMEKQVRILSQLDKSTLRFLTDNTRITEFSPHLQQQLREAYDKANTARSILSFPRSPIGGVSFQADTDNRKSFPNDKCFHQFKKQRDVFYELIRDWEDKRQNTGWSLVDVHGERIRWLVTFRTDLTNHLHFARLFLSQLIVMCKGDKSVKCDGEDETVTLLTQLKKTNPEKFKKLQERFIKPFSLGGPCPTPSFTGYQEFFRDFITAAGNAIFNQHLTNTLVAKVTELNNTEFGTSSGDRTISTSSETEEEEDQHELFASCLMTLRLLGKFLGFVTFLPYQTTEPLPDSMRASYTAHRNTIPSPLDFVATVHGAISSRRLVLTIPWLVEFASQMDSIAPTVQVYQRFLSGLRHVLRISWERASTNQCFYGNLMVVVLISWLFDTPMMPDGLFFKEVSEEENRGDRGDTTQLLPLDDLDLVSQDLLYTCCPYVAEMRNLMMEFAVGTNTRGTIRKITPTAANTGQSATFTQKQLQTQLEENFFHNHPSSLKRTVEFVGERTASNFIKQFRSSILPKQLTAAKQRVKDLKERLKLLDKDKRKMGLQSEEVNRLVPLVYADLKTLVNREQREFCQKKTLAALKLLLPEEQSTSVVAMAADISSHLAESRITHWISTNITLGVIQTELTGSSSRFLCTHLLLGNQNSQTAPATEKPDISRHKENTRGLSDIICDIKDVIRCLLLYPSSQLDLAGCLDLLSEANTALVERQDLVPLVVKSLAQLIFNLAITAVLERPGAVSTEICARCISVWRQQLGKETEFDGLCCARVIHGLSKSHKSQARSSYTQFVISLLEEKITEPSTFRDACHRVIKISQSASLDLVPLGQVVGDLLRHFHKTEAVTSCFCKTLERLFHISAEGSQLARTVLPLLDKYVPLEGEEDKEHPEKEPQKIEQGENVDAFQENKHDDVPDDGVPDQDLPGQRKDTEAYCVNDVDSVTDAVQMLEIDAQSDSVEESGSNSGHKLLPSSPGRNHVECVKIVKRVSLSGIVESQDENGNRNKAKEEPNLILSSPGHCLETS
ncbi:codanin-1-like isoform X2 [Haliotis rufescens]|uniref:codanin-1-like isoform X2 n=1 Tax=Haliotis rufescens TaxID=6454 RepID=UPI00201F8045|nr:codanin-1-like isoform X2 [Haliotis rufescens]